MASILFPIAADERRKYERAFLHMPGQLFDPESKAIVECIITNLSAGGAAVECEANFAKTKLFILYIENFGRFEGRAILHPNGQKALEFSIRELKRARLTRMLKTFLEDGVEGVVQLRRFMRNQVAANRNIVLENGNHGTYDILDISINGLFLRTRLRPYIGEILNLGHIQVRVTRHDINGIAVEYVSQPSAPKEASAASLSVT